MKKLLVIHHVQAAVAGSKGNVAFAPVRKNVEFNLIDLVPGLPIGATKSHEAILNAARTMAMCGYPDNASGIWIAPSQIKSVEIVFE